jgi:hypothetical protein
MHKNNSVIFGKCMTGFLAFALLINLTSCSSDCRQLDALFDKIAGNEIISYGEWVMMTENLVNNRVVYRDCDRGLYNSDDLNNEVILDRIVSAADKTNRNPGFSRQLTLSLLNEYVNNHILRGDSFQQTQTRFEAFSGKYRNLFSSGFPELYSDNEYVSELFDEIYDSYIVSPRLYLERSGSMVFYDSGNRNFVTAMRQIINRFPQYSMDKKLVYVVADRVAHWDIPFSEFLQTSNIFRETQGMVNASWTDFPAIFRDILNNTRENQVSILFSDMIYDVQTLSPAISPEGFANQAKEMTHAIFNSHGDDFGVIILKMNGDYDGIYYPPNSDQFQYKGNRPYYISLIGKTTALQKLMTRETYTAVREFETLPGYEASHAMYRMPQAPWYSILVPHGKNSRYVQPARASLQEGRIAQLENARIHDREGNFSFVVAADLSALWFDESFKTDSRNYRISSRDDFYIDEIIPLKESEISSAAMRYAGNATHLIVLRTDQLNNPRQEINIEIINEFPEWIKNTSTLEDRSSEVIGFPATTFGFEQMAMGIYNAFYQAEGNSIISFNIVLN